MQLILTGVTGVAGLAIYRAALTDPSITAVTLLTRRPLPAWAELPPSIPSNKTTVITHTDYLTYSSELARTLASHDACVWAQGRSTRGMDAKEYEELTWGYPMAFLKAIKEARVGEQEVEKPFRFVYISGEGADPSGKTPFLFSRVKGRTEHDIVDFSASSPNMHAQSIRPAYFFPSNQYPEDAKHQRGWSAVLLDKIIGPVFGTLLPSGLTPIEDLGRFSVEVAKGRWPDTPMFRNTELKNLMKGLREQKGKAQRDEL